MEAIAGGWCLQERERMTPLRFSGGSWRREVPLMSFKTGQFSHQKLKPANPFSYRVLLFVSSESLMSFTLGDREV